MNNTTKIAASNFAQSQARKYVVDGPHLWISQLLWKRGSISSNKIWEEYQKDTSIDNREMIKSKTHLKQKLLKEMERQKKIRKGPALDFTRSNSKAGWELNGKKAFRNVHPEIFVQLRPKPTWQRNDVQKYLVEIGELEEVTEAIHDDEEDRELEEAHIEEVEIKLDSEIENLQKEYKKMK